MDKKTLQSLIDLRRELHQHPELSGEERETAKRIKSFFEPLKADECIENLGGTGLAFVYKGKEEGKTSLFRCELDGLPILEENSLPYKSSVTGKAHVCGHDGHMAIIAGLGKFLAQNPPQQGRCILLFQPAEENGYGASAVLADKQYQKLQPDYAFALHNLPGYPLHQVVLKKGAFTAASTGMHIQLKGRNAHAAHPEAGNSPAEAMSQLIVALQHMPKAMSSFSLATVIHALLGEIAYGTTPGYADVRVTLRAYEDEVLEKLVGYAERIVAEITKKYGLAYNIDYTEVFSATVNDEKAWEYGNQAAKSLELPIKHVRNPFRWSEDFGAFSAQIPSLYFGLGSGKKQPQLHEQNYDFPDTLIPTGVNLFAGIARQLHFYR